MTSAASCAPIDISATSWPRSRTSAAVIRSAPSSSSASSTLRACTLLLSCVTDIGDSARGPPYLAPRRPVGCDVPAHPPAGLRCARCTRRLTPTRAHRIDALLDDAPDRPAVPPAGMSSVTPSRPVPGGSGETPPPRAAERSAEDRAPFERYLDRRDPVDRELLVERFLPLARQLARRYQRPPEPVAALLHLSALRLLHARPEEPFDDLFQVACLGLVKAIDRFDLSREVAFSSYAVPTILGEIKRYFRDRTWAIRVPRDLQELALRVDRTVTELSTDLHRQPTVAELASALSLDEEEVLEALEASAAYRTTSLSLPRSNEDEAGETLGDTVGTSEDGFGLAEDRATLDRLLQSVSPREREVLRLRFEEDLTQAEIGALIGVSQMQVSRIIRQSLARLRGIAEPQA